MAKLSAAVQLALVCLPAVATALGATGAEVHHPAQMLSLNASAATLDWSHGAASWQQIADLSEKESLWSQPNYCDARVLHSSAPLTVLFGVSKFWEEIKQRRHALASAPGKPLEVHILGAAYPFEGRSDWSLLASRRPPDVPKVKVVLVLGTPWHQDNVPVMKAKEFDEQRSLLMQIGAQIRKPEVGKMRDGAIECRNKGSLAGDDASFRKADLCKDHGNGLEVVCIEKYYQDVQAELPKPDVVAMFSPGFPQIARRSWDQVLRSLLQQEVPVMVCDLLYAKSLGKVFTHGTKDSPVPPGKKWPVKPSSFEDGMTLRAMRAYGARKLGAFRNPFPILINRESNDVTAKNAVLQIFRGRLNHAKPWKFPSAKAKERRQSLISSMDLEHAMEDESSAEEIKSSMLIPTSKSYDKAMWQIYRKQIRGWVQERLNERELSKKPVNPEWMAMVEQLGLAGKPRKQAWNLKEWIFVLEKLKVADEFF